jgi:hypothetical protein
VLAGRHGAMRADGPFAAQSTGRAPIRC